MQNFGGRQIRCIMGDVQVAYSKLRRLLFLTVSSYSRRNVAGGLGQVEQVTF